MGGAGILDFTSEKQFRVSQREAELEFLRRRRGGIISLKDSRGKIRHPDEQGWSP